MDDWVAVGDCGELWMSVGDCRGTVDECVWEYG